MCMSALLGNLLVDDYSMNGARCMEEITVGSHTFRGGSCESVAP